MNCTNVFTYVTFATLLYCLSYAAASNDQIDVIKIAGSKHVVVYPLKMARLYHTDEPQPSNYEIPLLNDLKLSLRQIKDKFFQMLEKFIEDKDKSIYIGPGIYICENGQCSEVKPNEEQKKLLTEPTKGKQIFMGNELTKTFAKTKNNIISPPPLLESKPLNLRELEKHREQMKERKQETSTLNSENQEDNKKSS